MAFSCAIKPPETEATRSAHGMTRTIPSRDRNVGVESIHGAVVYLVRQISGNWQHPGRPPESCSWSKGADQCRKPRRAKITASHDAPARGSQSRAAGTRPTGVGRASAVKQGPSRTASSSKLSRIGLSADPCSRSRSSPNRVAGNMHTSGAAWELLIFHCPTFNVSMSTFILGARGIPCLAVELGEIEPLELVPVAVDDAHSADRLGTS